MSRPERAALASRAGVTPDPAQPPKLTYSVAEAAARLGYGVTTLRRLIRAREITVHTIDDHSKELRISERAIREYIDRRESIGVT